MGSANPPKRLRKLNQKLCDQGWIYKPTADNHPRWVPPSGWTTPKGTPARPVKFSSTPSDHRGDKNALALLKRQGVDVSGL